MLVSVWVQDYHQKRRGYRIMSSSFVFLLLSSMVVGSVAFLIPPTAPGVKSLDISSSPACVYQRVAATWMPPKRVSAVATTRRAAGDGYDGEEMFLSEENAEIALQQIRNELTTLFGYSAENRAVGITGEVEFVELDGIDIVVRLKGRFWHDRNMVLARVANAMQSKIPEATVRIEHPSQLQGGGDDAKSVEQFYA